MLFANVDGQKVEATPKAQGTCPSCDQAVIAKCGKIKIWHWAHKIVNCDNWYERESQWHKNWKLIFGKKRCEIAIIKEGVRHIADVVTIDNVIIELQNSPIDICTIYEREAFYGESMIWIINGISFKDNFRYYQSSSPGLDDDDDYWYRHNPLAGIRPQSRMVDYNFTWNRCKTSWEDVQRQVYIDFGDANLFCVTQGMGTNNGRGKPIPKHEFLRLHGGDVSLLETLIDR